MLASGFLLGLLGSLHCIGMCGPIALMLPVDRNNKAKQTLQILSYHLGRIIAYSIIGLLFGVLGKGFKLLGFQQQISIIMGILMILAITLPSIFKKFTSYNPFTKWIIRIKSLLGQELKNKRNDTFFTIGFLNGFLPCGLVYMALLGAIAMHNITYGSLYMMLFGAGTVPLMTGVIYLGNFTSLNFRNNIQKIIPIVVVIIGLLFIVRGLGLGIPYISTSNTISITTDTIKGCH
ncbi:sulfite exporter TauE/SafE family protein [Tenacibaculum geojense]|uniref:Sulfite exporter TauE/SafE family protein n=1 Tax=Tenacibaculum geojense TaxID=915352 RepID=A0ABW3JWK6_9FLAO